MSGISHMGVGASGPTLMIPAMSLSLLKAAPWNPRKAFASAALGELAADIAQHGVALHTLCAAQRCPAPEHPHFEPALSATDGAA